MLFVLVNSLHQHTSQTPVPLYDTASMTREVQVLPAVLSGRTKTIHKGQKLHVEVSFCNILSYIKSRFPQEKSRGTGKKQVSKWQIPDESSGGLTPSSMNFITASSPV